MDPDLALVLFPVVVVGGYLLWRATRRAGPELELRRTRPVTVAGATEGEIVKLRGRVRLPGPPSEAPVSGAPCAAYELWIEHRARHAPGSRTNALRTWQDGDARAGVTPFLLEDDTGVALVEATEDTIELVGRDATWLTVGDRREHVLALLAERADPRLVREHELRYLEQPVLEGDEVVVRGRVAGRAALPADGGGYRGDLEVPRLVGTDDVPITVSLRLDL